MSRCSRPYSDDVVKPLSINEQLPFRLAILTSSASHRNHRERHPARRMMVFAGLAENPRRSSPIRPSSDNVVSPLSHYTAIIVPLVDFSE
ncbi:hypothetical protein DPMN_091262 [Dreissena polymorpha]|uniref:Uncharacterized protein n=1 Tax=Dreissena polymorpha TaxID=45954 RepID=A0A9D4QZ29_DREPO|nr:hypothetical protein DPMN_091262 [Dreissena polymorpha]